MIYLLITVNVSPPPVCCPTSRSCWRPAQAASCPVPTERFPDCRLWQLSAAGWAPLRAPTPSPALHLECGAVPGRATPSGLSWRRQREIMWQMPSSLGGVPTCPTAHCRLMLTWAALLTLQPGIFTHRWFTVLKHKDENIFISRRVSWRLKFTKKKNLKGRQPVGADAGAGADSGTAGSVSV